MLTIKNKFYRAEINEHGAELTHLINLQDNFDYMWNGDDWKRHAPVLFPSIGKSNDDSYLLDGKSYKMPQHGFARDYNWEVSKKNEDHVELVFNNNIETMTIYPFEFTLTADFKITDAGLRISYTVLNKSNQIMPFALGSHPGFNVPLTDEGNFDDYEVVLSPDVKAIEQFQIDPIPFRTGKKVPLKQTNGSHIPLTHEFFDNGLIIIANDGLAGATLQSKSGEHAVTLTLQNFPYFALWTMEHKKAPFLCMEPFAGLPDIYGQPGDWRDKQGNTNLLPQSAKQFSYEMRLK